MQFPVDVIRVKKVPHPLRLPRCFESVEPFAAAFRARPVAGRKRDRLVEKKQLCVASRRHDASVASFEFQKTRDPAPARILANDLTLLIVERPTTVAHEGSPRLQGENLATGCYTVL